MKILDFLSKNAIKVGLEGSSKKAVIKELAGVLCKSENIKDSDEIIKILMEREKLGSTGIGQGIAIPHGKTDKIKGIKAVLGITKTGIDFDSLDGDPVNLIFIFIAPSDASGIHLKALAKISHLLKDKYFRESLKQAQTPQEVIEIIKEEDE